MSTPTIGRIVHYRLTADQAMKTNARRDDAQRNIPKMRAERPGFQAHIGNPAGEGRIYPMIVTAVWPDEFGPGLHGVNGQVFLDGNDTLWVTSAREGGLSGEWSWPPRS